MPYTIDQHNPPPFLVGIQYWERSLNPNRPEAYKEIASNVCDWVVSILFGSFTDTNRYPPGWLGIDWYENPVAFVEDGTTADVKEEAILKTGPYGNVCAYDPEDVDLMARHTTWIKEKEND